MALILLSLCLTLLAAVVAAVPIFHPPSRTALSVAIVVTASVLGLLPCLCVLTGQPADAFHASWEMPFGSLALRLDALAAFFLAPIFGLGVLNALYGSSYLLHATDEKKLGFAWCCFHLLLGSMVLVVLAANGVLFLVAWELTVLSSFFLVILDSEKETNRQAGWIYLTASHFGAAFLIVLFLLLERETGSFDFAGFAKAAYLSPSLKGIIFLLALIGFGTKAGFIPLHVWLPEAHPAAPSHVSSLMSGVMIKTGIYGLLRISFFLGHPAPWWGWTILVIGLTSGILGVLFALAQKDLKKLLAYSSVENIGIIALGLGLGLLGASMGNHAVAALGFAGGLLHVLNHATFKGLLFLCAGAVLERTRTREIDRLGGLLRRMPWTGTSFLIGSLAISGLPPFNGFVGEFLIYFGALLAVISGNGPLAVPGFLVLVGLSLIGGLATACFAMVFSVVFLGNPRTPEAVGAKEVGVTMKVSMVTLAVFCGLIAVVSPFLLGILGRVLCLHPDFAGGSELDLVFVSVFAPLAWITICSFILPVLLGLVLLLRQRLMSNRTIRNGLTWDCGYAQPAVSMQYTGSSFAQPLTELFHPFLQTEVQLSGVDGFFPRKASFLTHTLDLFQEKLFKPIFSTVAAVLHRFTWIQNGIVQLYVLYISLTLVVLLIGVFL